jgi:hypothetical protein
MPHYRKADKADDDVIWGANGIASVINTTPKRAYYLLEKKELPAKKIGGRWCSTRGRLLRHFNEEV